MGQFEISANFSVSAKELFEAWLNSEQHSAMTGGEANCSDQTGGSFTAWDGYISGLNLKIVPYEQIVQSWRTTEFDSEDEDSKITIFLQDNDDSCKLTLIHTNIPEGQPDYQSGWQEHYFDPMKDYFG